MKKWKERGKRIAVLLLTAALIGSSVDLSALTVNAAEDAAYNGSVVKTKI